MTAVLTETTLDLPLSARGKVRDIYDLGDKLLIVATDRISAGQPNRRADPGGEGVDTTVQGNKLFIKCLLREWSLFSREPDPR